MRDSVSANTLNPSALFDATLENPCNLKLCRHSCFSINFVSVSSIVNRPTRQRKDEKRKCEMLRCFSFGKENFSNSSSLLPKMHLIWSSSKSGHLLDRTSILLTEQWPARCLSTLRPGLLLARATNNSSLAEGIQWLDGLEHNRVPWISTRSRSYSWIWICIWIW